jgi:D-cysteine desulfhydrase
MTPRRQLEDIDRSRLIEQSSPVVALDRIFPSGNVWLKDDSRLHPVCGGNKVRRLEYLLAGLGADRPVLTFGYESSNHVVATAYFCARLGVPAQFVLQRGPAGQCDADVASARLKMRFVRGHASRVSVFDSRAGVVWGALTTLARELGRAVVLPAGGSNALGALGSMRAAFELSDQVERQELPRPDVIVVPIGTGATAVGLAVGVRALGWDTRVLAVRIAKDSLNEPPHLRKLAVGMRRRLPALSASMVDLTNLEVEDGLMGSSYGIPTTQSRQVVERWATLQGFHLENTYSAKAAAALEARLPDLSGKSILFWLTFGDFKHAN